MISEEWRPVVGYVGYYEVSNYGRVRSLDRVLDCGRRVKGILLEPQNAGAGYLFVKLRKNGKGKTGYVHRLVAEAFLPNPLNLPEVNHKDEDKANNKAENLEWCDRRYNLTYNDRHLKVGKKLSVNEQNRLSVAQSK